MTSLQNDDETLSRKSSVYNQTGQTYFQQLSAYNRMSAHLRRVLLAPCVVDCRNKRYMRDKDLGRAKLSMSRSKSLDKIRIHGNIIDGVAYDTEHHPLDVLRMNLECNSECPGMVKRIAESCTGCNDLSSRSRVGQTTRSLVAKIPTNLDNDRGICSCLRSHVCKPCSTSTPKRESEKSGRSSGSRVSRRTSDDRGQCQKKLSHGNRSTKRFISRNNVEETEDFYSYDSSFESSSETSSALGSPNRRNSVNRRDERTESPNAVDENDIRTDKISVNIERTEEAKYAKFIYDVTREIMNSGLYTDHELRAIFKKHIDTNSGTLDRNKMQSEIHQLRMSLNVPPVSDDENDDDDDDGNDADEVDRFVGSGKFAKLSPERPPTPPKILDDNELMEKLRNKEEAIRFGETRKHRDSHGKNTVVLVDANPELLITERDVLLTLIDMKLNPLQIRNICKSLRNKSRETVVSQTVQVDTEVSYPRGKQDRGNSPINSRNGIRANEFHHSHQDQTIQTPGVARKTQICQCQCRENLTNVHYSAEQSQTEFRPDIMIQTTMDDSRSDGSRVASRSRSSFRETTLRSRSIGSSQSKKLRDERENDESRSKAGKTSREASLSTERTFRDSSITPTRLGSMKSKINQSEEIGDDEELDKIMKINSRRSTSTSQHENKSETNSSRKSKDRHSGEKEKTLKINSRRETSIAGVGNVGNNDSSAKIRRSVDSQKARKSKINSRTTSTERVSNENEDKSPSLSKAEIKRESKRKPTVEISNKGAMKTERKNTKTESVGSQDSRDDENSNILFVSHSEFLNNLDRDEAGSLPDISERSEAIEEDIESDEIMTIGSQTTPRPSQVEEVSDNESGNVSENTYHVDEAPIAGESSISMVSENIEDFRSSSPTEAASAEKLGKKTSRATKIDDEKENNFNDRISHSSIQEVFEDSEKENDSDVDERENLSIRKKTLSRIDNDTDEKRRKTTILSESTSRSSASSNDKINKSMKSINVKRNSNSDDKIDDITSSETELDKLKISNSDVKSHIDVKINQIKSRDQSKITNAESSKPDEEYRKSYQLEDQITIDEISESKRDIYRAERDFDRSNGDVREEDLDISERRKRTKSICSSRFGSTIRTKNFQGSKSFNSETSETSDKTSGKSEEIEERGGESYPDYFVTTASDISFLRKQKLDDSDNKLSIHVSSDPNERGNRDKVVSSHFDDEKSMTSNIRKTTEMSSHYRNSNQSEIKDSPINSHFSMDLGKELQRQESGHSGNSVTNKFKAAMKYIMSRNSKSNSSTEQTGKISSGNVSPVTKNPRYSGREIFSNSQQAKAKLSSTLAPKNRNSSCVCASTLKRVRNSRIENCPIHCKDRRLVCEGNCTGFHR